jgi:hypothetical protein
MYPRPGPSDSIITPKPRPDDLDQLYKRPVKRSRTPEKAALLASCGYDFPPLTMAAAVPAIPRQA